MTSGPTSLRAYATLAQQHPLVGEAQTCGLMGCAATRQGQGDRRRRFPPTSKSAWSAAATASRNGLIMRAVGDRMIVAPPLVITRAQIDEMVALTTRCLDLTLADVRRNGWMS